MLRRLALRSLHASKAAAPARSFSKLEAYKNPRSDKFSMTKVVGTIGPVSESPEMTQRLTDEGLRIMRINFSHAEYDEALLRINNLRACRGVHWSPSHNFNLRAVLLDTKGPEIRTGKMKDGKKIKLETGKEITLTTDPAFENIGTVDKIYITYDKLSTTVKVGDTVLLSDGLIHLTAVKVEGNEVRCVINNTEEIGNRKGVNLPGLIVELPALSEKDMLDLEFGVKNDVDFIAASFIRKASDVEQIKEFVAGCVAKYWPADYVAPKIISKIENLEGIQNFDSILEASDGIMVARGDLGVEVPLQKVLTYQKHMVEKCNAVGKPVIVATQMLESMINNPRPTRAEVSDVGNAVLDGADCVMLSGEVAQGKYPVESVRTMMTVVREADELLMNNHYELEFESATSDVESIASSAVKTAHEMNAKLLIVLTETGFTARMVAKYKPTVPVMCFTNNKKIGRQLQVHRGLYPVVPAEQDRRPTTAEAIKDAKKMGWLVPGDRVVVLSSDSLSEDLGNQIVMRVANVA
jgi:pyruvate kinase